MDIQWVKYFRGSWHAARPKDHADTAYCGRSLDKFSEISHELPAGKSCETCLRSVARLQDDDRSAV